MQHGSGIPLLSYVEPFLEPIASNESCDGDIAVASLVGRCRRSGAYINSFCTFEESGWVCSCCETLNDYSTGYNSRYLGGPDARKDCAELRSSIIDLPIEEEVRSIPDVISACGM